MTNTTFDVESREKTVKPKQLRREGKLPANIYGAGKESVSLSIDTKEFKNKYKEVGDTGLLYLEVDGKKKVPVLVDDVQDDPMTADLLHVVFREVDLKDKITAEIPVEIVGEFDVNNAVLVTLRDTIEVEALPTDLPEKFEIFVEELSEVGHSVSFADLKYDKGKVEIILGEEELEEKVVLVQEVKEEVEEEPVEAEEGAEGAEGEASAEAAEEKKEESAE